MHAFRTERRNVSQHKNMPRHQSFHSYPDSFYSLTENRHPNPRNLKISQNNWKYSSYYPPQDNSASFAFHNQSIARSKRHRIFEDTPRKLELQHISFGVSLNNLNFEELDSSLVPEFLYRPICGCEGKMETCVRLKSMISESRLKQMRAKYTNIKDSAGCKGYQKAYMEIRAFRKKLPANYPEPLISSIQNLLQLLPVDDASFSLLYSIHWHSKSQYLTYWIYSQITPLTYNTVGFRGAVHRLIKSHSKDLIQLLSNFQIGDFLDKFVNGCGTSIIPIQQFGKFIEGLNKSGKEFMGRMLFAYLLYHKKRIAGLCAKGDKVDLSSYLESLAGKNHTCWGSIFNAANSSYLK